MLKKLRIALAVLFWLGVTLLLLDFTGTLHAYLGWMARVQFLPAVLALNVGVIAGLVLLTLVFGRVYCSVICPLGVFQDGIAWLRAHRSKKAYAFRKENKWLRYGIWVLFVVALVAGINVIVSLLAPYSSYGRIVQNLFQPVYLWGNNLLAWIAERAGSYAFYEKEVWLRSLPTFIVAAVTFVVIAVLAFRGGRTYCNDICPVGTTLSFFSRFAMFRPVIDESQCVRCHSCEHKCKAQCIEITKEHVGIDYSRCVDCFNCIDTCPKGRIKYRFAWGKKDSSPSVQNDKADTGRRAFMSGAAVALGAAALKGVEAKAQSLTKVDGGFAAVLPKQAPEREVPLTPPGSIGPKDFYRHCTACQLCVAECPNNVLRPSDNLKHLMQPQMSYEKGFCRPECTRCSKLCPSGAIRRITREEKTQYHIGTARVNPELCFMATGKTTCGKCVQACPSGAIKLVPFGEHRIPAIAEEVCTGCGACEYLCPVRPISAITVNGKHQHV
jgi:ferredoxin